MKKVLFTGVVVASMVLAACQGSVPAEGEMTP